MRTLLALLICSAAACGSGSRPHGDFDAQPPKEACVGIECLIVDCSHTGSGNPTSISGTVYAPNGTLALYGATVYVPRLDPGPLPAGPQCDRCDPSGELPGGAIARTTSDEAGHFSLSNVPAGTDIPLVIQIGKWRRKALLPMVTQCTDNPQPANLTSLPKNHTEGDLPKIAIASAGCDALECLVRRLGVSDYEFTSDSGSGAVHIYNDGGFTTIGSSNLTAATALWADPNKLKNYDIVMNSCECSQNASTKPQASMDNMKAYADIGGRLFNSHYGNVWIAGDLTAPTHAPAVWKDIATWVDNYPTASSDMIDQASNPKGMSFAQWMNNVGGSTTIGQVAIDSSSFRQTVNTLDPAKAERWIYWDTGSAQYPQNFQFTTPNEAAQNARCGKVVFSDMHVAGDSFASGTFPTGCSTAPLSPQEKALAFMFFDIASCVQVIQ
ncbi:MAG: carboxypeptidase regulatory-like domain-containing protein [Deltaproteobacteria bacterium]|nr:carboxypeptidase regulatory-like domain-containing protein [Deltaproteobacteria bacterium]